MLQLVRTNVCFPWSHRCNLSAYNASPMTSSGAGGRPLPSHLLLVSLGLICALELSFSVRRLSQTWDEADHLLAGYRSWRCADFGFDALHPPLAKLVAAAPLLWMPLRQVGPACEAREVGDEFEDGRQFLYANVADTGPSCDDSIPIGPRFTCLAIRASAIWSASRVISDRSSHLGT